MIGDQERSFLIGMPCAAKFAHGAAEAEQTFNGGCTQRHEHFWLNDFDLLCQIRQAGLHLLRSGGAITAGRAWRVGPALQDVGDINRIAAEAHGCDDFGQQLPRPPYEWFTLCVLVHARRFADKHQIGIRMANSKNGLPARACEMRAFQADADSRLNCAQAIAFPWICERALFQERFQCAAGCESRARRFFAQSLEGRNNQVESGVKSHHANDVNFCIGLQSLS